MLIDSVAWNRAIDGGACQCWYCWKMPASGVAMERARAPGIKPPPLSRARLCELWCLCMCVGRSRSRGLPLVLVVGRRVRRPGSCAGYAVPRRAAPRTGAAEPAAAPLR